MSDNRRVGKDGESVVRRFYELATAGDPACWDRAAVIYTVGDDKIVRAEHFMDRSAAREATGA